MKAPVKSKRTCANTVTAEQQGQEKLERKIRLARRREISSRLICLPAEEGDSSNSIPSRRCERSSHCEVVGRTGARLDTLASEGCRWRVRLNSRSCAVGQSLAYACYPQQMAEGRCFKTLEVFRHPVQPLSLLLPQPVRATTYRCFLRMFVPNKPANPDLCRSSCLINRGKVMNFFTIVRQLRVGRTERSKSSRAYDADDHTTASTYHSCATIISQEAAPSRRGDALSVERPLAATRIAWGALSATELPSMRNRICLTACK